MSFIGVVLGAAAGVLLAPHVVTHIDGTRAKTFATLFMILALVVIGVIAGSVVGARCAAPSATVAPDSSTHWWAWCCRWRWCCCRLADGHPAEVVDPTEFGCRGT